MTDPEITVRLANKGDVSELLGLLPQITSRPASLAAVTPGVDASLDIFDQISSNNNIEIVVGEQTATRNLVGALTIAIVPSFIYGGKPWAIIETVVVDAAFRGKGIGKKVMGFAFDLAEDRGCYKVQLLSGTNNNQIGFYRSLGFEDGTSVGFKKYFVDRN